MTQVTVDASLFRCGHLERVPLGTPYPGIVAHVARLLAKLPAGTEMVIDYTGVGRPVFDMFLHAGLSPVGVLITAGTAETRDGAIIGVPKLSLIVRIQALLHENRLKIHKDLAEAAELVNELRDFRVDFTAAGSLTFNARSGRHDDLVLALALAVWRAYGGGIPNAGLLELARMEMARLRGAEEAPRTVVGVDLGQARDPTAIAVVQRVPATRTEERPDLPVRPAPARPRPVYARGSLEYCRQAEEERQQWAEEEERRQRAAAAATAGDADERLPP